MNDLKFNVNLYSPLVRINELLSLCRVRIFYTGLNRNRTYISEEVAEEMIRSLPYVPVCGLYEPEEEDFTVHNKTTSRAYGVVPENPNARWEDFEDEDGVTRTYLCCDVLLWTGRYKNAEEIFGKPQSMELNQETLEGSWEYDENGVEFFRISHASFIGLQVLGDSTSPCFQGAAFYSLYNDLKQAMEDLKLFELQQQKNTGGLEEMAIFKGENAEVLNKIFEQLNTEFTEDNKRVVDFAVINAKNNVALVYDYTKEAPMYVNYQVDDEGNYTVGDSNSAIFMEVCEADKNSLEQLKSYNNNSFEGIDEIFNANVEKVNSLTEENEGLKAQVADNQNVSEFEQNIANLQEEIAQYKAELEQMQAYKKAIENEKRQAVYNKFNSVLKEEIEANKESYDKMDADVLKKELSALYVEKLENQANVSEFSLNIVPDLNIQKVSGVEKLVKTYR